MDGSEGGGWGAGRELQGGGGGRSYKKGRSSGLGRVRWGSKARTGKEDFLKLNHFNEPRSKRVKLH
jgi:hypothetical protein